MATVLKYLAEDGVTWLPFLGDVPAPSASIITKSTVLGDVDGTNTIFVTAQPYVGGSLQVYINGLAQSNLANEVNPSTGVFSITPAPQEGDNIAAGYQVAGTSTGNADMVDGYHANATPTPNTIPVLDADGGLPHGLMGVAGYQVDNNDTIESVSSGTMPKVQMGWAQFPGDDTASFSGTITFPIEFTEVLGVMISPIAAKSSVATDISDMGVMGGVGNYIRTGQVTNEGVSFVYERNGTMSASSRYGISWIAWGLI